jgi:hypothetical protein
MGKPTVAIDFDGVMHSYERGWDDGSVYGTVVPGFWDWAYEAAKHFRLVIVSSRLSNPHQAVEVANWLQTQHQAFCTERQLIQPLPDLELSWSRPPAWVTIDDRAVRFDGDWLAPELQPENLLGFLPWHYKKDS